MLEKYVFDSNSMTALTHEELMTIDGGLPGILELFIAGVAIWYTSYCVGKDIGASIRVQEEIDSYEETKDIEVDVITCAAISC